MMQEYMKRIAELEPKVAETARQLVEAQARLQESPREVTSFAAGANVLKKQLNDLLPLRDNVASAEAQPATSKLEATALRDKLAAASTEITRLKAAAALPPSSSAMGKKRSISMLMYEAVRKMHEPQRISNNAQASRTSVPQSLYPNSRRSLRIGERLCSAIAGFNA